MQKTILFFITATWVVCSVFTAHAQTTTEKRPNIIFLLSDDQVDLSVGAYGNDQAKTPNMDQLAREGTLFRNP